MPLTRANDKPPIWRQRLIFAAMLAVFALLGARVIHLQTTEHERLRAEGDSRHLRELAVPPERGRILDRNGRVLAMSTPVDSLSATPAIFCAAPELWKPLLEIIEMREQQLRAVCERRAHSGFMYLKRHLPPMLAEQVMQLGIAGIGIEREYKRYYPDGPAGAHLIGFTNIDDVGQEGLEKAREAQLVGTPGRIRVLQDQAGNQVESVESIQPVRHGEDLVISIDQRVQSLASDYLEFAVRQHKASGGSVVVLAVPSGEIMAMVNSPQFNPNDRSTLSADAFRNRSVTDVLEPGSTAKPFTAAMALESGKVDADTTVDTAPGEHRVGSHTIQDIRDFGTLSVSEVISRSSNVGIAKLALTFPYNELFDTFARVGFAHAAADLPGEISGRLQRRGRPIEHASLAYGYGVSVTALQLARAYTVFATDGELLALTLQPQEPGYRADATRVFSAQTARAVRAMLEQAAAAPTGTANQARVPRYRVGGKTGTVHKLLGGNYDNNRYLSVFAGLGPISQPRFVAVVVVDDPRGESYYGGKVAAPVFADLMADLMRLYNIRPDAAVPTPGKST